MVYFRLLLVLFYIIIIFLIDVFLDIAKFQIYNQFLAVAFSF